MKKTINILFSGLAYLEDNYGAQAILLPLVDKLNEHFNGNHAIILSPRCYNKDNIQISEKYELDVVLAPRPFAALAQCYFLFSVLYRCICLLKGKAALTREEKRQYNFLIQKIKESDIIINISGIELVGSKSLKVNFLRYINAAWLELILQRYNKTYLKYTKSYGPFIGRIYRFFVRRQLNNLPFVFVRGEKNLEAVKRLKLKVPVYCFPDVSIILEPASKEWARDYIKSLGVDPSKTTIGLSPSSMIVNKSSYHKGNSSCGLNHIKLCKEAINFFQEQGKEILIIPHSINRYNPKFCDLILSERIYNSLEDKSNVFIIRGILTYEKVKAIIGLLDFYITARYHSLSSALSMGVPVVSLSWHIKYQDIMSLFLDDFLAVDCSATNISDALCLIKRYYNNEKWFDKNEVLKRKEEAVRQVNKSIEILVSEIRRHI